jgi:hypothetical protein
VSLHVESFFETKLYLPAIYVPGKQKDSIHWEKIINLKSSKEKLKKNAHQMYSKAQQHRARALVCVLLQLL